MLVVDNVHKNFGGHQALGGVTLAVARQEILAVIGPSGCGKTTLLRVIAGFEPPDDGRVVLGGVAVSTPGLMVAPHRRRVSMVFQDLALWPHMTVRQHLDFVAHRAGHSPHGRRERMDSLLSSVRLGDHGGRYPHQLSGGEKQRLAIARALAAEPVHLLMDEPFSHLDPLLVEDLQNLTRRLFHELHMGVVYVTHHVREAAAIADQVAVMREGRVIQVGRKENVLGASPEDALKRILAAD
jgi:ABC-type Fe3+/spermidine/putrescine transport system ATPase subunit